MGARPDIINRAIESILPRVPQKLLDEIVGVSMEFKGLVRWLEYAVALEGQIDLEGFLDTLTKAEDAIALVVAPAGIITEDEKNRLLREIENLERSVHTSEFRNALAEAQALENKWDVLTRRRVVQFDPRPGSEVAGRERDPFCEPGDAALVQMMFRGLNQAWQSGWRNWAIYDVARVGTVVETSTSGRRKTDLPFEIVEHRLKVFQEELVKEGLEHGTADFEARVEEWLDDTFPKVC